MASTLMQTPVRVALPSAAFAAAGTSALHTSAPQKATRIDDAEGFPPRGPAPA